MSYRKLDAGEKGKYHGIRTNLDYVGLVSKRDSRAGCPGIVKIGSTRSEFEQSRKAD